MAKNKKKAPYKFDLEVDKLINAGERFGMVNLALELTVMFDSVCPRDAALNCKAFTRETFNDFLEHAQARITVRKAIHSGK